MEDKKARIKALLALIIISAMVIAFYYIMNRPTALELREGLYVTDKEQTASLLIKADREFVLNRHIATSFQPSGKYEIQGERLILHDPMSDIFFTITAEGLVFDHGELADALIKSGQVFYYLEGSAATVTK